MTGKPDKKKQYSRRSVMVPTEGDEVYKLRLKRLAESHGITLAKLVRLALDNTYPALARDSDANSGTESFQHD